MKKNSFTIFLNIIAGIIGLSILIYYIKPAQEFSFLPDKEPSAEPYFGKVLIKTTYGNIDGLLATSSEARVRGLSGRESLKPDQGMLFVFERPDISGFWMKDMLFPLDIIWIDENKKIVGINENVSPETFPNLFFSPKPVLYVLELNAGIAKEMKLSTSTTLSFVI